MTFMNSYVFGTGQDTSCLCRYNRKSCIYSLEMEAERFAVSCKVLLNKPINTLVDETLRSNRTCNQNVCYSTLQHST